MIDNLLDFITKAAWLLFAGYTIAFFVRTVMTQGIMQAFIMFFTWQIIGPLLAVIGLNFLSISLVFINPPEIGVVISVVSSQGIRDRPFSSGLHWIIPLVEEIETYPISWQTYTMSSKLSEGQQLGDDSIRARTSDGQEVMLDCSLIFRIDPEQVVEVHINWQQRYIQDLVRPVMRGIVRTQVSQFTVEEVNSSARKDLEATLDRLLREKFEEEGLILNQFLLRDISFSPEYAASIEQKQVALEGQKQKEYEAEQMRELARGKADSLEIEAQGQANALLIESQAKAEAIKLLKESFGGIDKVLTHEYIDKLSPSIRVMLVPSDTPLILPLPELEEGVPPTTTLEFPLPSPTPTLTTTATATPTSRLGEP